MDSKVKIEFNKSNLDELKDGLIRHYLISSCTKQEVPLKCFISEFEKELLTKALKISKGNQRVASFILGCKPTTLNEKIKKYKIGDQRKKSPREEAIRILELTDFSSL